ncbi:acyl carrier protein [Nocardiopsis sp. CNT312]|uniref:acyl carrier protein n=1 Tax=Nocardiopsis sp. CNT312 TaxID=1137268 RepID=UPI00048AE7B8|nr:acyl carrier protein [Nocardiopsis sp. CNT312]
MPEDKNEAPVNDLEQWLTRQVATYLDRKPEEIDQHTLFTDHGLDSVYALTFCADIEDFLGITVSDTLLWDYATIRALADHLTELVAGSGRQGAGTP